MRDYTGAKNAFTTLTTIVIENFRKIKSKEQFIESVPYHLQELDYETTYRLPGTVYANASWTSTVGFLPLIQASTNS